MRPASGNKAGYGLKFTRDPAAANTVRKIERGSITVGDRTFTNSIGLLAESILESWPTLPFAELDELSLKPMLDHQPEMLIIGCGWEPVLPPRRLVFAMARAGIGVEVMNTPAACRTFNILISEDRRPGAILYID